MIYAFLETDLGRVLAAKSARGLAWLSLVSDDATALAALKSRTKAVEYKDDEGAFDDIATLLDRWEEGPSLRGIVLDLQGTAFQEKIWAALREVPYGALSSYQALARAAGLPRAVRAVGNAVGANPVAVLVPCHRVLRVNGELGGYAWGVEKKRQLLETEQRGLAEAA